MRIALIACSKEKLDRPCPARELYSASTLFSLSYRYAKTWADRVFVLSAKYGLVDEDCIIEPYEKTLKRMARSQQLVWADDVLKDLASACDIESDEFMLLAGNAYCKDIAPHLPCCSMPLEGLPLGRRLVRLKQLLSETESLAPVPSSSMCGRLHGLFCGLPRYAWDQIGEAPFSNGIYVMFEKGERYCAMDRVVLVGTHTSHNRLKARLASHFVREEHDGSIFRKNVGKAILNASHDSYLATWTLDTSKPENRVRMDRAKNAEVEQQVSAHIREKCTFVALRVDDKSQRLRMKEALIAALCAGPGFTPSSEWLGLYSPEHEIRESGMWLKRGLDAAPMTEDEYARLLGLCGAERSVNAAT